MRLKSIELAGFKSFAKKTSLTFGSAVTAVVGPNGSGKSNIAESFRFVLGEQSMKSMRGKRGEDLVWQGSAAVPRAGRASVKLIFDNADRTLPVDFDEVALERVVHRDGGNDYLLNGSVVRLRDIGELLSRAGIGASGHHIISQGEADRALTASVRERREMVEDALGLTAYLYRREEARKKLAETAENIAKVESLQRELAPHLRFLNAQVKKIEESQKLRDELEERVAEYLKREQVYVKSAEARLAAQLAEPEREYARLEAQIALLKEGLSRRRDDRSHELVRLEQEVRVARDAAARAARELGRIEGEIAARQKFSHDDDGAVPMRELRAFGDEIAAMLDQLHDLEGVPLREKIAALAAHVREFVASVGRGGGNGPEAAAALEQKKKMLDEEVAAEETKRRRAEELMATLRTEIEGEKDADHDAERELFAAMERIREVSGQLASLRMQTDLLARDSQAFREELAEAVALVPRAALRFETHVVLGADGLPISDDTLAHESRSAQESRHKALERMKIRLEESGAAGAEEVLKEHREVSERTEFLARELTDLKDSSEKLHTLIDELTATLGSKFESGIEQINREFNRFFTLLFGGGSAALTNIPADEEAGTEAGVDVAVLLPHKRVKGMHMLSGGERALTSIALIFAMSQVNPPPFLILDETEAALDEANSRRYGDLLEELAKRSQLIVITHNRETMSRAGILYGVTMGSDGASRLLSVKFEEAVGVAK